MGKVKNAVDNMLKIYYNIIGFINILYIDGNNIL